MLRISKIYITNFDLSYLNHTVYQDDQIDKAGSFIAAAEHLKKCDAKCIYVIATHGILSGDSIKMIENCSAIHKVSLPNSDEQTVRIELIRFFYQLVVTNTFPIPPEKRCQSSKLVIIDVSATFAEAIRRTHYGESISFLFQ